jgi:hypothetical protein
MTSDKDYQPSGISRAEEKASIAAYGWQSDDDGRLSLEMFPEPFKRGYLQGYEQAEKDTLERVISWLKDNANKYIVDIGVGYGEHGRNVELVVSGKCWDDLKKAMEE